MDKMRMESLDMTIQNIEKIGVLFPNCITEMLDEEKSTPEKKIYKKTINFEILKQMLADDVIEGSEAYEFTWVGKKAAIVEANKPIRKTLRPCKEESVNWDTTENLYIEGDNLEVLKLLQESYLGAVKMIYIDPPYNTGSDSFVYPDNYSMDREEYEALIDMYDESGNVVFRENSISNPRFHSDWCSMMYSRLMLARNLLSDEGVIFFSIGEEEVSNAIAMCDEIFGAANVVSKIARVSKTASNMGTYFAPSVDFILCYAKDIRKLPAFVGEVDESLYPKIETSGPRKGEKYRDDVALYQASLTLERSRNARYFINCPDGSKCIPPENKRWRVVEETVLELLKNDMIVFKETKTSPLFDENGNRSKWNLYTKSYLSDRKGTGTLPRNYIDKFINRQGADLIKKYDIPFDFAKPVGLIKYLMEIINDSDALILDFFSGSATTAHSTMQLNSEDNGCRKFIMIQLPEICSENSDAFKQGYENICEIGKERIRRVGSKIKEDSPLTTQNLDTGFRVFKLDDTNMTDVFYSATEYSQGMLSMLESNVKVDRTDLDLLFGCLLEWGLPLSLPYISEDIEGCTVHTYGMNNDDLKTILSEVESGIETINRIPLIACFDENIPDNVIKTIAKRQPLRAVFRDSSFASSPSKINVGEVFKLLAPDTRVKVI